ncbi:hypothetical protein J6590_063207 [Homalodisca vitripennis]|nr:hypothetical protein J6590_063207 [Homalodisca vitripennis]
MAFIDHSPQRGLHTPNSFFHSQLRHTQQCRFNYQLASSVTGTTLAGSGLGHKWCTIQSSSTWPSCDHSPQRGLHTPNSFFHMTGTTLAGSGLGHKWCTIQSSSTWPSCDHSPQRGLHTPNSFFHMTGTTLAGSGLGHKWCTIQSSSTWPSCDHSPQRGLHTPNSFFHSQLRHTQQCRFNYQVCEFSDWHNTSWLRSRLQVVHYTEPLNMAFIHQIASSTLASSVTGTTLAGSGLGHKWCTIQSSSTWPSYDHSPQRGLHTPNSFFHSQLRHTQQCRFNYQVYEFSDWHNTSWLRSRPQVVH